MAGSPAPPARLAHGPMPPSGAGGPLFRHALYFPAFFLPAFRSLGDP
jgi:hypothetical protein